MISRFRFSLVSLFGAALLTASTLPVAAQTPQPSGIESHPACKVVYDYLSMILTRKYDKSVDIMDEGALVSLRKDYVDRIKHAPTMEDEEAMIRRLDVSTVDQVEKMSARDFYTAYNIGLGKEHPVPEAALAVIRKTLEFKVLSVAQETDKLVHVLVRTKHENGKYRFESLDLITLVKNGEKWQIAPNRQAPRVTPLEGAEGPTVADPVRKPAVDPVKKTAGDSVKPAPKTSGPKRKSNP